MSFAAGPASMWKLGGTLGRNYVAMKNVRDIGHISFGQVNYGISPSSCESISGLPTSAVRMTIALIMRMRAKLQCHHRKPNATRG
jgi:hypothetical protein